MKHDIECSTQIAAIITQYEAGKFGPWNGDIDPERFDVDIVYGE